MSVAVCVCLSERVFQCAICDSFLEVGGGSGNTAQCYRFDAVPKAHLDNGIMSMLLRRLHGRIRPPVSDKMRQQTIMQIAVGNCMSRQMQNANDTR